jgi:hypothetical protein
MVIGSLETRREMPSKRSHGVSHEVRRARRAGLALAAGEFLGKITRRLSYF